MKNTITTLKILSFSIVILGTPLQASEFKLEHVKEFPKFGPMVRDLTSDTITIVGQGKLSKKKPHVHGRAILFEESADGQSDNGKSYTFEMLKDDRQVGFLNINGLKPNQQYRISIGYAAGRVEDVGASQSQNISYSWEKAHSFRFMTAPIIQGDQFSILVGSCRRIGLFTPLMDAFGDKIFKGMVKNVEALRAQGIKTNFVFFGGDQIYADALNDFNPAKTFEEYAELYEKAFSLKHFRKLTASTGTPTFMQRDDHELWNDADAEEELKRQDQAAAGYKSYALYQRPQGPLTPKFWHTTQNGVDTFFTDTRSERLPSKNLIMSVEQMDDLKSWMIAPERRNRIKIVTTSVPIFLLSTPDSWGGFNAQKLELVDHIVKNKIEHLVFVSGDAHCQKDAQFKIYDHQGSDTGINVVEVLVSGLFAITREKADFIRDQSEALVDGEGYILKSATPLAETLKENLFARITGDQGTKKITISVHDKKNHLLKKEVEYQL